VVTSSQLPCSGHQAVKQNKSQFDKTQVDDVAVRCVNVGSLSTAQNADGVSVL
jgi:hypothetical protein